MSYDLMVFEKTKAPRIKKEFMEWYEKQTMWEEEHNYQSVDVTSPALKKFFLEIIKTFPPMNGEFAPDDITFSENENLESYLTEYSIGYDMIYAGFAWSVAEEAYQKMRELAKKHEVGFFDVSGSIGDIILPDGTKIE